MVSPIKVKWTAASNLPATATGGKRKMPETRNVTKGNQGNEAAASCFFGICSGGVGGAQRAIF
jgi:hypothetical protein